jgi:hypothetical protein
MVSYNFGLLVFQVFYIHINYEFHIEGDFDEINYNMCVIYFINLTRKFIWRKRFKYIRSLLLICMKIMYDVLHI